MTQESKVGIGGLILAFVTLVVIFKSNNTSRHIPTDQEAVAALPKSILEHPVPSSFSRDENINSCKNLDSNFEAFVNDAISSNSYVQSQAFIGKAILATAKDQKISVDDKIGCLRYFIAIDRKNIPTGSFLAEVLGTVGSELAKIPDMQDLQAKYQAAEGLLDATQIKVEELQNGMKEIVYLNGVIAAQQGEQIYEFVTTGGMRGILQTTSIRFQNRGYFSIAAKKIKDVDIKLKEEFGGFDAKWPVFLEVENAKEMRSNLKAAKTEFAEMKKSYALVKADLEKTKVASKEITDTELEKIAAIQVPDRELAQTK
jgi:hypothetical protein